MPTMQLALTFHNLNYYVDTPPVNLKPHLEMFCSACMLFIEVAT
jgi:hypothetical protein